MGNAKTDLHRTGGLGCFGYYVEIFEDHLVGAINEDHSGLQDAGKVYAYHLDSDDQWVLDDVLMADEPGNGDYFGTNLGFYGDYAFIGAPYHDYDEQGGTTSWPKPAQPIFSNASPTTSGSRCANWWPPIARRTISSARTSISATGA
ncbi:MAG: hypothetical protein IPJ00_11075 [Saprospirales bacterium]|nr:hypothetical protein [Saprospirales bacterium]